MKHLSLLIFALATIKLAAGCSNPSADRKDTDAPNESQSPRSSQANSASANAEPANISAAVPPGSFADKANGRTMVDVPSSGPPPLRFMPAGEESEVATTMTPDGSIFEVRRFKRHPRLNRVEATWINPQEKLVRYFLRDGQVIERKTDRITNLQSASTDLLLDVAGMGGVPRSGDSNGERKPKRAPQ